MISPTMIAPTSEPTNAPTMPPQKRSGRKIVKCQIARPIITQASSPISASRGACCAVVCVSARLWSVLEHEVLGREVGGRVALRRLGLGALGLGRRRLLRDAGAGRPRRPRRPALAWPVLVLDVEVARPAPGTRRARSARPAPPARSGCRAASACVCGRARRRPARRRRSSRRPARAPSSRTMRARRLR